jgi:cytochrome b involved in lipid metabolism
METPIAPITVYSPVDAANLKERPFTAANIVSEADNKFLDKAGTTGSPTKTPTVKEGDIKESGNLLKKDKSVYTSNDVKKHAIETDCWVIIEKTVLDLTKFVQMYNNFNSRHRGGSNKIISLCGKDGTKDFQNMHAIEILENVSNLKIGTTL